MVSVPSIHVHVMLSRLTLNSRVLDYTENTGKIVLELVVVETTDFLNHEAV